MCTYTHTHTHTHSNFVQLSCNITPTAFFSPFDFFTYLHKPRMYFADCRQLIINLRNGETWQTNPFSQFIHLKVLNWPVFTTPLSKFQLPSPCVSYPSQSGPSICGSCRPPDAAWREVTSACLCPEPNPAAAAAAAAAAEAAVRHGCSSGILPGFQIRFKLRFKDRTFVKNTKLQKLCIDQTHTHTHIHIHIHIHTHSSMHACTLLNRHRKAHWHIYKIE